MDIESLGKIVTIMTGALVILQFVALIYMMYTNYIRFKEEKKVWKRAETMERALINSLKNPLQLNNNDENKGE
jgi:hypothetical protein